MQSVFILATLTRRFPHIFSPLCNEVMFAPLAAAKPWTRIPSAFVAGETYEMKVVVENNQMAVYVDGVHGMRGGARPMLPGMRAVRIRGRTPSDALAFV